ncbi:hypothetical protein HY383_02245 [Candidatus Daviesbacteria bacterium]|nr:hypothetical protein [Candidatus Daviesbacteria bacterium]
MECTQIDAVTGATTVWNKDLKSFRESRTDRLPSSPLYRYVSRKIESGNIPQEPSYVIEKHADGLHKEVTLEPDTALSSWEVWLQIADESVPDFFFVAYKRGELYEVRVHHNSTDLMVAYQDELRQLLPDNLKALAQLCRIEGAMATFYPEMGPIHDEPDTAQKEYLDWAKDDPKRKADEIMRAWSEDEKARARMEVVAIVGSTVAEHLKDDYSQEEIDAVSCDLADEVIGDLPFDFNTREDAYQRVELIADSLVSNVAMLLATNKDKYESLSNFTTYFYFDQDNKDVVRVVVEDSDFEVIHRGHLRFGERYRYQEHDYSLHKDSKASVIATVAGILRPKPQLQISVPERVNLDEFVRSIRFPEAVGWERALSVADIEYQKIL